MDIDRLFLAQDGLYIVYSPYELGRPGYEDVLIGYIPLTDLAGLGANTALWGK